MDLGRPFSRVHIPFQPLPLHLNLESLLGMGCGCTYTTRPYTPGQTPTAPCPSWQLNVQELWAQPGEHPGSILAPGTGLGTSTRAQAEQGCQLFLAETCCASDNVCSTVRFSSFISYHCHTCLSVPTQGLTSATASTQQPGDELSRVNTVKAKPLDSAGKVLNDASSHHCWCMNTSTPCCLLSC